MAVIPKTNPIFAILLPITLPKEISLKPSSAAFTLTKSSGAEVAKDTTVKPMTIFEIRNRKERATEERTRYSPPTTNKVSPERMYRRLTKLMAAKILNSIAQNHWEFLSFLILNNESYRYITK